jgi:hypothetical protein
MGALLNFVLYELGKRLSGVAWTSIVAVWLVAALIGWIIFPFFFSRRERYVKSGWEQLLARVGFAAAWGGVAGCLVAHFMGVM